MVVVGLGALVLVLVLLAGWMIWFSSTLATRQVAVDGAQELSAGQVRDAAQVPMGRPLARVDLQAIAERTARLPQVASAQVARDWPSTVRVTVVERRPLLAVAQPGGQLMIDKTGLAYETRSDVPTGVLTADVNPDDAPLLIGLGVVASALPPELRDQVKGLSATSRDNIVLTLESGVVVTWGSSSDSPLKAEVTGALLKGDGLKGDGLQGDGLKSDGSKGTRVSIDVSSPHNPAVR